MTDLATAWEGVIVELIAKQLRARALAAFARMQAQQTTNAEFAARYMGTAESADALAVVYLALAEHARAARQALTQSKPKVQA